MAFSVRQWLGELELDQYCKTFEENDLDLDLITDLSDDDLKEIGVVSMGHRKKLLRAIEALDGPPQTAAAAASQDNGKRLEKSATPSHAERRQLTVMFTDLVGSTALSQRMDPEDLRDIMGRYQDAVGKVVDDYGGVVAKFLGDGALAYFGWPQAHEDQTERALRAGLASIEAIQEILLDEGQALQARAGIATGQVVIGDLIGETASESDAVIGDTPNLASRIQELAEPGQLVIDTTTHRLVGNAFDLHDLGKLPLKGFSEPQSVWRVEGGGAAPSRFDETGNAAVTNFVGRRSELGLLRETWEQAKDGEGQLLLLSGEAGIGKSRLIQAFLEQMGQQRHVRLRYQCSSFHTNSTLFPVIQQLRRALGFNESGDADDQLDKLDQLLRLEQAGGGNETKALFSSLLSLPHEHHYGSLQLAPQQRKERILQALNEQMLALSSSAPVLFFLEDAHWIDPTTLELLQMSIPMIAAAPVLMIITHRPEWRPPPWTEVYGNVVSLSLGRLPRSLVRQMVRTIASNSNDEELVQRIAARTDGIPLYVEEITKAALESTYPSEAVHLDVPESLQTSLLARLDRLGDAKVLAQIGAVIGREFSYELLACVTNMATDDLNHALSRIVKSGLLFQKGTPPDSIYTFKHALVQDAAYGSLLRSRRRELHSEIAEALETIFPERSASEPELLAHHYTEGGLIESAIKRWHEAGKQARERSANKEAMAHFGKALELLAPMEETPAKARQELALRAGLGVPLSATKGAGDPGNYENYERARLLSLQFDDAPEFYQVHWGSWRANLAIGNLAEARNLADQLLKFAKGNQDTSLLLEAHHAKWTTLSRIHEPLECWKQAEQGIALYEVEKHHGHVYTITDHDAGVCCRCFGSLSLWQLGYPERGLALVRDGSALAKKLAHPTSMVHSLSHSTWFYQLCKNHDTVIEHADAVEAYATERGYAQYVATGKILKGWSLAQLGHGDEGLRLIKQGLASGQAKGTGQSNAYFLHLLADAYLQLGQARDGLDCIGDALSEIEQAGTSAFEPEMRRINGELLRLEGDDNGAEENFRAAMTSAESQSARMLQLRAAGGLARLCCDQGRLSDAREYLAPVYDWFTEGFDTPDLRDARSLLDSLS